MYAEYYAKDPSCALTEEEFERLAVMADAITAKCRWDKIFLVAPRGVFVDDHERYMAHSGMKERQELFDILVKNLKESGNWDKVVVLNGASYYDNFMTIVNYVREVMAR
jgi:nicotinamide riboside kinase